MSIQTTAACLAAEDLAAFVDGRLVGAERARVIHHLAHCPRCYETLSGVVQFLEEEGGAPQEATDQSTDEGKTVPFRGSKGRPRRTAWLLPLAAGIAILAAGMGWYLYRSLGRPPALVASDLLAPVSGRVSALPTDWQGIPVRRGPSEEAATMAALFATGVALVDLQAAVMRDDSDDIGDLLGSLRRYETPEQGGAAEGSPSLESLFHRLESAESSAQRRSIVGEIESYLDREYGDPEYLESDFEYGLGKWTEAGRLSAVLADPTFFLEGSPGRRYLRWLRSRGQRYLLTDALPLVDAIDEIARQGPSEAGTSPPLDEADFAALDQAFHAILGIYAPVSDGADWPDEFGAE